MKRLQLTKIYERSSGVFPSDDGGIGAAQSVLQTECAPQDAATSGPNLHGAARVENRVRAIPSDIQADFPAYRSSTELRHTCTLDTLRLLQESERVYDGCTATTPDSVRARVATILIQAYLDRGLWADFESFARRFVAQASIGFEPRARKIVELWAVVADAYRGRSIAIPLLTKRFWLTMQDAELRALVDGDVIARDYCLRGDRRNARAMLDRALEAAMSTKIPLVASLAALDVAFEAWFDGDDERFESHLRLLESLLDPQIERGFRLFIMCARGKVDAASADAERMRTRAYAFVIAASLEGERRRRTLYLNVALVSADYSAQPFAQILVRVALALSMDGTKREEIFEEAQRLADGTCSPALQIAVRRTRHFRSAGTMLGAFAHRFTMANPLQCPRAIVNLAVGTVTIEDRDVRLSEREAQLVTLLALRGTVHPDDIIDVLWPDFEGDRAAASLKVYVSRLRKLAGDRNFVVYEPQGYRLQMTPSIVRASHLATRFTRWGWIGGLEESTACCCALKAR